MRGHFRIRFNEESPSCHKGLEWRQTRDNSSHKGLQNIRGQHTYISGSFAAFVVSYDTLSRLCQIQAHESHHGTGIDIRLSLMVASSTIQVTVRFSLVQNQFRSPGDGGRVSTASLPPTT
ncbi:hypothetical protein TNCV_2585481 [Trichonephila clavipes]|nr:hypothetical protein TNCV_2585481 [Trichonephila clavipes]